MSDSKKPKVTIPPLSAEEAQSLVKKVEEVSTNYKGLFDELENAIGMLMIGRLVGWKVLVLIHNKRTIKKYEEILGINIREYFPAEGPLIGKSVGYEIVQKIGNFWKAVSGDLKDDDLREHRRSLT
jgi:hypothetical protein